MAQQFEKQPQPEGKKEGKETLVDLSEMKGETERLRKITGIGRGNTLMDRLLFLRQKNVTNEVVKVKINDLVEERDKKRLNLKNLSRSEQFTLEVYTLVIHKLQLLDELLDRQSKLKDKDGKEFRELQKRSDALSEVLLRMTMAMCAEKFVDNVASICEDYVADIPTIPKKYQSRNASNEQGTLSVIKGLNDLMPSYQLITKIYYAEASIPELEKSSEAEDKKVLASMREAAKELRAQLPKVTKNKLSKDTSLQQLQEEAATLEQEIKRGYTHNVHFSLEGKDMSTGQKTKKEYTVPVWYAMYYQSMRETGEMTAEEVKEGGEAKNLEKWLVLLEVDLKAAQSLRRYITTYTRTSTLFTVVSGTRMQPLPRVTLSATQELKVLPEDMTMEYAQRALAKNDGEKLVDKIFNDETQTMEWILSTLIDADLRSKNSIKLAEDVQKLLFNGSLWIKRFLIDAKGITWTATDLTLGPLAPLRRRLRNWLGNDKADIVKELRKKADELEEKAVDCKKSSKLYSDALEEKRKLLYDPKDGLVIKIREYKNSTPLERHKKRNEILQTIVTLAQAHEQIAEEEVKYDAVITDALHYLGTVKKEMEIGDENISWRDTAEGAVALALSLYLWKVGASKNNLGGRGFGRWYSTTWMRFVPGLGQLNVFVGGIDKLRGLPLTSSDKALKEIKDMKEQLKQLNEKMDKLLQDPERNKSEIDRLAQEKLAEEKALERALENRAAAERAAQTLGSQAGTGKDSVTFESKEQGKSYKCEIDTKAKKASLTGDGWKVVVENGKIVTWDGAVPEGVVKHANQLVALIDFPDLHTNFQLELKGSTSATPEPPPPDPLRVLPRTLGDIPEIRRAFLYVDLLAPDGKVIDAKTLKSMPAEERAALEKQLAEPEVKRQMGALEKPSTTPEVREVVIEVKGAKYTARAKPPTKTK